MSDSLTLIEYEIAEKLHLRDVPFNALIAAAMRTADTFNLARLKDAFPNVWDDLMFRKATSGGIMKERGEKQGDENHAKSIASLYV